MDARGFLKEVQKILPYQDPEPLPEITKRKKILLRASNSQEDLSHNWGATHISLHISGAPYLMCQVKFSGHKVRPEGSTVPGRERIDNQWVPESKFKELIFNFFCLPIWIWEGWDKWNFTFFSQLSSTDKDLERADFGKNFHPFLASASFPRILSTGFEWVGCPRGIPPYLQKL